MLLKLLLKKMNNKYNSMNINSSEKKFGQLTTNSNLNETINSEFPNSI